MPIYQYQCPECDTFFDKRQGFHDEAKAECPTCAYPLARRKLSLPAIVFKGSGFYVTDTRNGNSVNGKSSSNNGKSDGGESKSATESKATETTSESKSSSNESQNSDSKNKNGSSESKSSSSESKATVETKATSKASS